MPGITAWLFSAGSQSGQFLLKSRKMAGTFITHFSPTISQLASFEQLCPSSTTHALEQPSPSRTLPSSHSSPSTMPSPHLEAQAPVAQLGSERQLGPQPSNGSVLPSSQLSAPSGLPSPQVVGEQALGAPLHLKPFSMRHLASQPSPAATLVSSQPSLGSVTPSPQR